ncbi:MAG: sporulation protein YqfC [Clostridia bacterium]|nr:sporulation protein YqfC [Clostridia bacterium]
MKRKPHKESKRFRERLSDTFAIPEDILLDLPRITAGGNRELEIENYKNVLEYLDSSIQLNCKDYVIKICGKKLEITAITDESVCIRGVISSISFIR